MKIILIGHKLGIVLFTLPLVLSRTGSGARAAPHGGIGFEAMRLGRIVITRTEGTSKAGKHTVLTVASNTFTGPEYGSMGSVDLLFGLKFQQKGTGWIRSWEETFYLGPRLLRDGVSKGRMLPILGFEGQLALTDRVGLKLQVLNESLVTTKISAGLSVKVLKHVWIGLNGVDFEGGSSRDGTISAGLGVEY